MTAAVRVPVTAVRTVVSGLLDQAWDLYEAAFAELNTLAVQRHLMYRPEFDEVMADRRVGKYLSWRGDTLTGLATYTNCLDAVPLISPQYFERRWPTLFAEGRIWYVGFVAVAADAPVDVYPELIAAMHAESGPGAVTVLDVCNRMNHVKHLPRSTRALLHHIAGGVRMHVLDAQTYVAYDFGALPDG